MFICLYMYTCIYMHICICIHAYMHICIYVYMHICTYVYMYICICVYMYMCIHTYVHMYICIYLYMYMCHATRMFTCMLSTRTEQKCILFQADPRTDPHHDNSKSAHVCVSVCLCVRANAPACLRGWLGSAACVRACVRACVLGAETTRAAAAAKSKQDHMRGFIDRFRANAGKA